MAINTTTPRSRRALLTVAIGSAAAALAASVAKVSPVGAADDEFVRVGNSYTASSMTSIERTNGGAIKGKTGAGIGLIGDAETGTGVLAESTSGTALTAQGFGGVGLEVKNGRIRVTEVSGVATIKKGKKSVTIAPGVDISWRTFVLLTPMVNMGSRALWFTKSPSTNKFTIRMSSPRGGPTKIAWLALERG